MVLSVSAAYIFYRFRNFDFSQIQNFPVIRDASTFFITLAFFFFLSFSALNWILESIKWKHLVSTIKHIDLLTAAGQTFAAFSASVATPAKAGDYGAKALFFHTTERKRIMGLNLISNLMQMAVTTFFGLIGLSFFLLQFVNMELTARLAISFSGLGLIGFLLFLFRKKDFLWSGVSIQKLIGFYSKIDKCIKIKVFILSCWRYITFSFMLYFLLLFFGLELSFSLTMLLIFTMYFLVSIVPTIFIFDFIIRGGVAVWLFSFYDISDAIVLSSIAVMWLFNFVLPAIVGSYFIVSFKPVLK